MWGPVRRTLADMRRAGWREIAGDIAGALSLMALIWLGFVAAGVL